MVSAHSVAGAGLVTLLAYLTVTQLDSPPTEPGGHLILQIHGDANSLRVTRITAKPDPYGIHRLETPHSIVVHADDGTVLGSYPLDLSLFDLDPAHVGRPARVEGDRLIDTSVAALANIPRHPNAARLTLMHGARLLGEVRTDVYRKLIAEDEVR